MPGQITAPQKNGGKATRSPYEMARGLLAAAPREDAPSFEALGRFVTAYAQAEAEVHQLARRLIVVSDAKARIILGGMRLTHVAHIIRRLLALKKATSKFKEVDACLTQLEAVSKERDKLVHRYVSYAEKALRATNRLTAKSIANAEDDAYSERDLTEMELDCRAIAVRLALARVPALRKHAGSEAKSALYAPWRYKPKPAPRQGGQ
jgi:hypothetical protein